jgi:O-antigen/teichoic acid export membrane protein
MKFTKSIKQIITLYSATILSLVSGIAISIFTTRFLGAEGYGDFKFFQLVFSLVFTILSFGFFNSISRLLAHSDSSDETKSLIGTYGVFVLFIGLFAILIVFIISFFQGQLFSNNLNLVFRYGSVFVIFFILNNSFAQILQGSNNIGLLSIQKIAPPVLFLICLIFVNKLNVKEAIIFFYGAMGLASLAVFYKLKPRFENISSVVKLVFKENKTFGRKVYFGSISNVGSGYLGGLLIGYYMDNSIVGFFTLSVTICTPLLMIPSIVGTTYFKKFASAIEIDRRILYLTMGISVISYIMFYFLIEKVVYIFYPSAFGEIINYSRLIALGSIFHGFGDLYNRFLYAKGNGNLIRNGAFVVGVFNVLGYFILIKFYAINGAIFTKVVSGGLYLFFMYYGYVKHIKRNKIIS